MIFPGPGIFLSDTCTARAKRTWTRSSRPILFDASFSPTTILHSRNCIDRQRYRDRCITQPWVFVRDADHSWSRTLSVGPDRVCAVFTTTSPTLHRQANFSRRQDIWARFFPWIFDRITCQRGRSLSLKPNSHHVTMARRIARNYVRYNDTDAVSVNFTRNDLCHDDLLSSSPETVAIGLRESLFGKKKKKC